MIERDDIQDLFSKSLENHTTPVRPEVWSGLQAKMVAAGVTTAAGTAAAKGMSLLTKWIIGSAAVATTAVVTTLVVIQNEPAKTIQPVAKTEQAPLSGEFVFEEKTADEQSTNENTTSTARTPEGTTTAADQRDGSVMNPFIPFEIPLISDSKPSDNTPADAGHQTTETSDQGTPIQQDTKGDDTKRTPVDVEPTPREESVEIVVLPDVFTPNGDRINDTYQLLSSKDVSPDGFGIVIYDSQMKVVAKSEDPNFEWDGTIHGDPALAGSYTCMVIGTYKNGKPIRERQRFELIRK